MLNYKILLNQHIHKIIFSEKNVYLRLFFINKFSFLNNT